MNRSLLTFVLAALGFLPVVVGAQHLQDGRVAFYTPVVPAELIRDSAPARRDVVVSRLLLSFGGAVVGGFAGGYIDNTLDNECNERECFFPHWLGGVLVGYLAGAAVGAVIPSSGQCDLAARLARGLMGTAIGAGLGVLTIIGAQEAGFPVLLLAIPAGATAAQGRC